MQKLHTADIAFCIIPEEKRLDPAGVIPDTISELKYLDPAVRVTLDTIIEVEDLDTARASHTYDIQYSSFIVHQNSIETHANRCTINDEYCTISKMQRLYPRQLYTRHKLQATPSGDTLDNNCQSATSIQTFGCKYTRQR